MKNWHVDKEFTYENRGLLIQSTTEQTYKDMFLTILVNTYVNNIKNKPPIYIYDVVNTKKIRLIQKR